MPNRIAKTAKYYSYIIAGGALLGLSFSTSHFSFAAFFAFIPLLVISEKQSNVATYGTALLFGSIAVIIANYWIYHFSINLTGSYLKSILILFIYSIYSAQTIALYAIINRLLFRSLNQGYSLFASPLIGTCIFSAFPNLFDFSLALTQTKSPLLVKTIALTGRDGLSYLVLLINISFYLIVIHYKKSPQPIASSFIIAIPYVALFAWITPTFLLSTTPAPLNTTEAIGFLQPNDPPRTTTIKPRGFYTLRFPKEIENSYALAKQGATVIIWPESRPKGMLDNASVLNAYKRHAGAMGSDLIVQDTGRRRRDGTFGMYNSSIFIEKNGRTAVYNKITRMPFGEYIPDSLNIFPLGELLHHLFKDINKKINAGNSYAIFKSNDLNILPLICYDILNTDLIHDAIRQSPEINLIVLQSNDSWFFSEKEVDMHNRFAVLIAVETGRPILHVNNGGPSYYISGQGKSVPLTTFNSSGAFLAHIPAPQTKDDTSSLLFTPPPRWFLLAASYLSIGVLLFIAFRKLLIICTGYFRHG